MLRTLLNRHPALAICGETRFCGDVYRRRWAFGNLNNVKNRRRLIEQYLSTQRIAQLGFDVASLRERLLPVATSYRELFSGMLRCYAEGQGKERWGEKTPHHAFFTETLCEWFPGASIVHLVRDPRDVVASLLRMPWAPDSILNNAWMWLLFNRAARRSRHRSAYLLVHYETLMAQPEQELARICAHLGEDYAPCMLVAEEPADGPYSWPRHARGPITRERLAKWREQLTAEEISLIEWAVGRDMPTYGYHRSAASPSIRAIARGLGWAAFDPVRMQVARFPYLCYYLIRPTNLAAQEYWKYRRVWETTATFSGLPSWNRPRK